MKNCRWLIFVVALTAHAASTAETYRTTVQPILARNCYGCHSDKLKTAGLSLEALRDPDAALKQPEVWEKVSSRLRSRQMPPAGLPAPTPAEIGQVGEWAAGLQAPGLQSAKAPAVTVHRLNRTEYNNTVRDLLGVYGHPADEFPVDDAGFGFDNNGDVLTLSPMLMEKYMATAEKLSRLAVFGPTLAPKPGLLASLMPKKGPEAALRPSSSGTITPYSIRGAMFGSFVFPVDADYEIRVRVINHRDQLSIDFMAPKEEFLKALNAAQHGTRVRTQHGNSKAAFPPEPLVVTLDGKKILEDAIEGDTDYLYDRGAFVARVPVKAGEHFVRASFPALADYDDPRRNINPDFRRRMYVEFAEIAGPFNPSQELPESHRRIFTCGQQTPECARTILRNFGLHAYRRPLEPDELGHLAGLVDLAQRNGDSFDEGIRLAVQAVLTSPAFLFRTRTRDDYELASRLSYFLWSSMPDDELFRLAAAKKLHEPAVLEAQTRRMLADAKSQALADNFGGQWLGIQHIERKPPDPDLFPTVDDELMEAMHRESTLFFSEIMREDRSVLDFLDAKFAWLNGPLANHYGIEGVKGEEFRRVELDGTQRSGILTQGAILAASAYQTRTSVVTRGKWVLENLLGTAPPPPPPDVPALVEKGLGTDASLRMRMEQHRSNPACSVCHNAMDPIGSVWRTTMPPGRGERMRGRFRLTLRACCRAESLSMARRG
jgi:mono/diheme cytochrome c family protein